MYEGKLGNGVGSYTGDLGYKQCSLWCAIIDHVCVPMGMIL